MYIPPTYYIYFFYSQAVQLSKFDYRLANKLETDFQKLRCRVNYHALRFTDPIIKMGQKLVNRMRKMGKHFIALHLRYASESAWCLHYMFLHHDNLALWEVTLVFLWANCKRLWYIAQFIVDMRPIFFE